jgi:hypothetical protein
MSNPASQPDSPPNGTPSDIAELVRGIHGDLADLRAREGELAPRERELQQRYLRVASHPTAPPAPTSTWLARRPTLSASIAVGVLAGLLVLVLYSPLHRATARVRVTTANSTPAVGLAQHRVALLDPRLLDEDPNAAALSGLWHLACTDGRVAVWITDDAAELRLSLVARSATEARRLVAAALESYAAQLLRRAAEAPPGSADLLARRESLQATLDALDDESAGAVALENLPDTGTHQQLSAAAAQLETELADLATKLDEARRELAVQVATELPRSELPPGAVEQALADDALYQEDRREFVAVAAQYRTELAVALFGVLEPARRLDAQAGQFVATVAEQLALNPPPDVRAVLEPAGPLLVQLRTQLATFLERWQPQAEAAQQFDVRGDLSALVKLQSTGADAARQLADAVSAATVDLGARIETLGTAADGRTRAVVVAAVLRTAHAALKSAADALTAAVRRTGLPDNIELDALDRKLRGLRTRLVHHEEAASLRLQAESARTAQTSHTEAVGLLRREIRQWEARREELVADLMSALRQLRDLDATFQARVAAETRAAQRAAERAWLSDRLTALEQQLAQLRVQAGTPDRLVSDEPTLSTVGPARPGVALLSALAGFAAVWLIAYSKKRGHY